MEHETIECRMGLQPETVSTLQVLQQVREHASLADTVAMTVRMAADVIGRLDNGATITVTFPDGREEVLRIEDNSDDTDKILTLSSLSETPDRSSN